jgi:hypothetical protein
VLIQQIVGAVRAPLLQCAFGFGSAKPCSVGFGLFPRLFPFNAFLESLQVDHFPHASLHHAIGYVRSAVSRLRACAPWELGLTVFLLDDIGGIPVVAPVSTSAKYAPMGSVTI